MEFLKRLLQVAKETLQTEKDVPPKGNEDRGKAAALTKLFNEVKTSEKPILVERPVVKSANNPEGAGSPGKATAAEQEGELRLPFLLGEVHFFCINSRK